MRIMLINNNKLIIMPNKDSSWKNINDWSKGKAKLQNAVYQHPDEGSTPQTSVYNFMKSKINNSVQGERNILDFSQYKKLGLGK